MFVCVRAGMRVGACTIVCSKLAALGPTAHRTARQSVRSYFPDDDDFNWNYGIALAAAGRHAEAEAALAAVTSEAYRCGLACWLQGTACRC